MSNQAKRLSDCPAERLAQCRGGLVPPVGGELEVLAWRVLGYNFNTEQFALDHARWAEDIEPVRYLVDRAHASRLQAEVSALQQRLNIADQRVCDLTAERGGLKDKVDLLEAQAQNDSEANTAIRAERDCYQSELTKARDMVRWFYTHANVHQVGTAMMDSARDFIANQSAPAAKLDASMIGIVHTPPMEHDEP
ncbi:hypothetical protein EC919_104168 [Pseudomonas graminis]|uniref:hypothetical protein n=1 Tax=Pseudomonas graminis TaxID=158627 RepID=UPI00105E519B|nr:hypothetical protein [Pseudomonas graminis]TDV54432.1 hypothetical protein EC919_104168 [Pseudomonas graminis]